MINSNVLTGKWKCDGIQLEIMNQKWNREISVTTDGKKYSEETTELFFDGGDTPYCFLQSFANIFVTSAKGYITRMF